MQANNEASVDHQSADKQASLLIQLERALMSYDCASALMALKAGARLDSSSPMWSSAVGDAAMCWPTPGAGAAREQSEFKELIDALLAQGAPIEGRDKDESTALMRASHWGRPREARYLLKRGADPRSTRHDQSCALYDAIVAGDVEMVELLIQNGASALGALERFRRSGWLELSPTVAMETLIAAAQAQEIALALKDTAALARSGPKAM